MNPTQRTTPAGRALRVRSSILLACTVLAASIAQAQTRQVRPETILCSWDGELVGDSLTEFPPDGAYNQEVEEILNAMTLQMAKNFELRPGSTPKAAALFEPGAAGGTPRRVILYSQEYFTLLPSLAGSWGRHAVLAHEVGHHLNNHPEVPGADPQREIQADRFAGRVLAVLGAPLEEATAVLADVDEHGTLTHPSRAQRRAAMVNGWFQQKPDDLHGTAVQVRLWAIEESSVERHSGDLVVTGTRLIDKRALIAGRIIFKPGARLLVSQAALDRDNSFFIVAREIVSDPKNPGTISWERPSPPPPPGSSGQAASGRHGGSDGESGAPGQPGATGAAGYPGEDAPSLILAVQKMGASSKVLVDLEGQSGGAGSTGQKGGDGGNGQRGSHASSSAIECRRGAGDGGDGGQGGPGGLGGPGGRGGRGGTLTLLAEAASLPSLKEQVEIKVNGGESGPAGVGGEGGNGGAGGPRGAPSLPWCKNDGEDGASGPRGPAGPAGPPSVRGPDGRFAIGELAAEKLRDLLTAQ